MKSSKIFKLVIHYAVISSFPHLKRATKLMREYTGGRYWQLTEEQPKVIHFSSNKLLLNSF